MSLKIAIITCSSSRSFAEDSAGATLERLIEERGWKLTERVVIPDIRSEIANAIIVAADAGADIILTCGGSGLSLQDVTPEATADVCERNVPGIAEAMRAASLQKTGRAMLSRAVVMQRGSTLVINLPGSEKAALENFEAVCEQFEHAVAMIAGGGH
ncbi:MAG: MogA/MoaB family molybdenum cofactor biosynthesis protein [Coriobacteriales bacterium]|jgi:molybdenum cofactor synthesis domain-containing protein|nr:MogA/MoaB family molybdenum cofactor biosynthesis protein [Coriobacteriales bacterium]